MTFTYLNLVFKISNCTQKSVFIDNETVQHIYNSMQPSSGHLVRGTTVTGHVPQKVMDLPKCYLPAMAASV